MEDILDKVKGKSLFINLVADFKKNELREVLFNNKNALEMKYSQYCKLDLKYGYLHEAAFYREVRDAKRNGLTEDDIYTHKELFNYYESYLLNLIEKRQEALAEAQRKLEECECMLEFIKRK